MSTDVIQARYDSLDAIAGRFSQQSAAIVQLNTAVKRGVEALEGGGWQGKGSAAFFAEMNTELFPALQRLRQVLDEGRAVTLEAKAILERAEQEAAALFQDSGERGSGKQLSEYGFSSGSGNVAAAPESRSPVMQGVHEVLDVAGFIPGLGVVPDLLNAGIYIAEGDFGNAAMSGLAAIPGLGDAIKGVDKARDIAKAVDKIDDAADGTRALDKANDARRGLSKLVEKYGDDGARIVDEYGEYGGDILKTYDQIAHVKGSDQLMKDLLSKSDSVRQGALSELGYAASLQKRGFEIEKVGDVINGKKAGDIVVKNGPVIDVKDYDWSAFTYKSERGIQQTADRLVQQAQKHRERYPGREVEFAFTDLEHAPKAIVDALRKAGVKVTKVTWPAQ